MSKTRQEHLQWCKDRAIEYLDQNDPQNAYASFASDMSKHPETANHMALPLGLIFMMGGHVDNVVEMRRWIEGFN